jgi:hypothetical protein
MDKSEEHESLASLISDKNTLESADFEIAFTATLATIVLSSTPISQVSAVVLKIISISLIMITLVRRMAISSRFADSDKLLKYTMLPIEFLTIVILFYFFYSPSEFIASVLSLNQNPLVISALLIPETIMILMILQELVFKNYMIWWAGFAFGQAINSENRLIKVTGGLIGLTAFKTSLIKNLPEELEEMQDIVDEIESKIESTLSEVNQEYENLEIPNSSEVAISASKAVIFFLSLFILLSVVLGTAFVLSILFGTVFQLFLLICSIIFIRHMVRFYYLAYGLPEENQIFGESATQAFAIYSLYAFSLYFVFVYF